MRHFWDEYNSIMRDYATSTSVNSDYAFTYAGDWKEDYSNTSSSVETCSGAYTYVWRDDSWHAESPTHTYSNSHYERFVDIWNKINVGSWFNYDPIEGAWKYVTPETQNKKIDPAELEELL